MEFRLYGYGYIELAKTGVYSLSGRGTTLLDTCHAGFKGIEMKGEFHYS